MDTIALLERVKKYIEGKEEDVDAEWGLGLPFKDILQEGRVDPLYHDVVEAIRLLKGCDDGHKQS